MGTTYHYPLSASGAKRWINCAGSLSMSRGQRNPSTQYNEEGTAAHLLGEMCFAQNKDADFFLGKSIVINEGTPDAVAYEVTEDMADAVQVRLDYIRGVLQEYQEAVHTVEESFCLPSIHRELGGTADDVVYIPGVKLIVADYKHGVGVPVNAERNIQGMIYALGAATEGGIFYAESQGETTSWDFPVEIVIIQPRSWRKDSAVQTWETTIGELEEWGRDVLLPAALAAEEENAPLVPGEWCQFCTAHPVCPEPRRLLMAVANVEPDEHMLPVQANPVLPDPRALPIEQKLKALTLGEMLAPWLKALKESIKADLMAGEPAYEGKLKLVQGEKGNRKWLDEKAAETKLFTLLRAEAVVVKVKSPAQAEKALKQAKKAGDRHLANTDIKAVMASLVSRSDGGLVVTTADDPRPAVHLLAGNPEAFDEFDVMSECSSQNKPLNPEVKYEFDTDDL